MCRDGLVVSVSASHAVRRGFMLRSCRDGLVVSVFTSHAVGCGFCTRSGHTKNHDKNGAKRLKLRAWHSSVRKEFGSATRLFKVWVLTVDN